LPRALEPESKAAPQDVSLPGSSIVRNANATALLPVEDRRILTFLRIEIEVGFHATGKHIQFRLAARPERSH
jgi:hypothetical protein